MAFTKNALFESYGIICWSPTPSSLPGEFSINETVMASFKSNSVYS